MLKLRIILLYNWIYYLILIFAILFGVVVGKFNSNASIYDSLNDFTGIITYINIETEKTSLKLKNKEVIIANYYKDDIDFSVYNLGDEVLIKGIYKPIVNSTVPNTFNYKKYLNNLDIYHVIQIESIELIKKNNNYLYKLKNLIIKRTFKLKKSFPYIRAFLIGDKSYVENNVIDSYRLNGISHLFAISGLHINIFIIILAFILKKISLPENKRYFILMVFLIFYMFVTNFSMSVVRSSIFTILLIINKKYYFHIKSINLLLLTLSMIIFYNPKLVFDVGLQYSFTITFFLILFQDYINGSNYLVTLFKTSLVAFICSFPITIYHFYEINLLSIIYNLFFVPFISFIILPLSILAYIFPFFDNILFLLIELLEHISIIIAKIDILKFIFCKPSILIIIIYYLIIFFTFLNKKIMYLFLILVFMHYYFPNVLTDNYYLMFDVGQGDSALFVIDKTVTLIDTGGYLSYDNNYKSPIIKNLVIPYLKSNGIKKIDNLILTHGDSDHMQDSIYLINNFKVNNVIINAGKINNLEQDLIKELDIKKIKYSVGLNDLSIGNYKMYFLNTKIFGNENDDSSVVYFNYNNIKFLMMGDAGKKAEQEILKYYRIINIDFLKVGHHGSDTSSSKDFIEEIHPINCFISVGKNNKYGHPKKETLDVLKNCNVYRTDIIGSIKVILNQNDYVIKNYN